jgi:hypothetical protein
VAEVAGGAELNQIIGRLLSGEADLADWYSARPGAGPRRR